MTAPQKFDVGGVMLERPFKIRRLGHFGYYSDHMEEAKHFYFDLLGFQVSDIIDFQARASSPDQFKGLGDPTAYFTRFGTDHHSFVLFPRKIFAAMGRPIPPLVSINQMTWQVGSLKEVVEASSWFKEAGVKVDRSGRDMPGSNWHTYMFDPEGNRNELYYGMEQIGWDGLSKPLPMHDRIFHKVADLPQVSEYQEVETATAKGVDLRSGYRYQETMKFDYEVSGIMMPRPFKVTSIGPIHLVAADVDAAVSFYRDRLGFVVSEEITWQGHRAVFLRGNTEHHAVAIYAKGIADELDLPHRTQCLSFGLRLNDYRQLRSAISYLKEHGVKILYLPPELFPGMDHTAFAVDPDGHLIQLYCYMEQIGWDGKPRPAETRRKVDNGAWPDKLEPLSDSFAGETFLGPWI
jgi:catechol 2,3-dioxygenase-like lactoylglutathione lyase family enzyme